MASTAERSAIFTMAVLAMLSACPSPPPPCLEVDGGDVSLRGGYFGDDREVTLAYDGPTKLRAILPGEVAAFIEVTPPPGVELAFAQNDGPTWISAAHDEDGDYVRLTDSRGVLFEGGSFYSLTPTMEPPALVELEEDGRSICTGRFGGRLMSVVAHVALDEPIDLLRGEYGFGELGGRPAFAMLPDATAIDHRGEPPPEEAGWGDISYDGRSAMFRLAEPPE